MNQVKNDENSELSKQIIDFCKHVAGSSKIEAIAIVDDYSKKTSNEGTIQGIMLIINDFQPRLMSYLKTINNRTVFVFAVDKWIFERDIERGFLGEAIASKLIFPHSVIAGNDYLNEREITLKKRLILELLENLVLTFPELAYRIQIKPQYFMYEVLSNRIRVFPLIVYDLTNLMSYFLNNEEQALKSYNEALKQLEKEKTVMRFNDYLTISKKFIAQCQDPKIKLINLSKNMPRTLFASIFGVLPQLMNIVTQNTEAFLKTQKINLLKQPSLGYKFIDTQKYVFLPTSNGIVSLSEKIDIKGFAKRMFPKNQIANIEVEPVGGMLNDVYLITAHGEGGQTKVLAKRFKDWSGFKWFPLTLWSFGARSFAVSGQARLAKEFAISEILHKEGFHVPQILHVSNAERIIFMEYIDDAENLSKAIKRVATSSNPVAIEDVVSKVRRVGELFAQVHSCKVSLGDTKPDNVLIKTDGTIFLIDFEQAIQNGDKAWDIAVFLYYSGHYLQPISNNGVVESITKAFIEGYLKGGGSVINVKKAGASKYTRVFSIFTMPPTMNVISDICKKTGD